MGKYEPLTHYLENQAEEIWDASFSDVERVLGFALPRSAHDYAAWWANQEPGHSQTLGWRDAGWETGNVDLAARKVRFKRRRQTAQPRRRRFPCRRPPQTQTDVGRGEMRSDRLVCDVSRDHDAIGDALSRDLVRQRRCLSRVADEQQADVASFGGERGERAQDRRDALFGRHLAERREDDRPVRQRERTSRGRACEDGGLDGRNTHADELDDDVRILLA